MCISHWIGVALAGSPDPTIVMSARGQWKAIITSEGELEGWETSGVGTIWIREIARSPR
jgi:hypothetical protein